MPGRLAAHLQATRSGFGSLPAAPPATVRRHAVSPDGTHVRQDARGTVRDTRKIYICIFG
jgi:hypothetical protein